MSTSQEYVGQLEENVARQNRESEEYSQSLLETIREKDSRFDELTAQMTQMRGIISGSLETLDGRKFVFPKTLSKIRSDLESVLSADDNEIEGE